MIFGYWLLVIGYWLLVIGYWLLVIGYWLLVINTRLLTLFWVIPRNEAIAGYVFHSPFDSWTVRYPPS
ncbi:hypothetical protein QUB63_26605 [Microcoleus sp. ARI1-B5]